MKRIVAPIPRYCQSGPASYIDLGSAPIGSPLPLDAALGLAHTVGTLEVGKRANPCSGVVRGGEAVLDQGALNRREGG